VDPTGWVGQDSPVGDVELLDAWCAGDADAGNLLVRRHFATVYRFFAGKLKDGVEDLVQETFLACVKLRERFRGDSSFRTFLLGIARIQLLRHLRKSARQEREFAPEEQSIDDAGMTAFEWLEARREQRVLLRALRRIPLDFQIAVELHYWEGMSVAEIASVTDVAVGTVKSRLARGREMARRQIERMNLDPEVQHSTLGGFERWVESLRGLLAADQHEGHEQRG
jgi:RNA polymerase sigma-70 factor (ECF subfamily)